MHATVSLLGWIVEGTGGVDLEDPMKSGEREPPINGGEETVANHLLELPGISGMYRAQPIGSGYKIRQFPRI